MTASSGVVSTRPRAAARPLPPLPALPLSWRRDVAIVAVTFLLTRLVIIGVFVARGRGVIFGDSGNCVALARSIVAHGDLSGADSAMRHFQGVPLLLAACARLTGEFTWTAVVLNLGLGVGAAVLFYRNFPDRRLALLHAFVLPAWLVSTSTLLSESGQWFFVLLGLTAFRLGGCRLVESALLIASGYALACRPTALLILLPLWWLAGRGNPRRLVSSALLLGISPILVRLWVWRATGSFSPEAPAQAGEFARWTAFYGGGFPSTAFSWPGHAFLAGLLHVRIGWEIKVLNLLHAAVAVIAVVAAWSRCRRPDHDGVDEAVFLGLAINLAFILCIGGPFGHTQFYRYLATQANPFIIVALWRTFLPSSRTCIFAAAASMVMACFACRQA